MKTCPLEALEEAQAATGGGRAGTDRSAPRPLVQSLKGLTSTHRKQEGDAKQLRAWGAGTRRTTRWPLAQGRKGRTSSRRAKGGCRSARWARKAGTGRSTPRPLAQRHKGRASTQREQRGMPDSKAGGGGRHRSQSTTLARPRPQRTRKHPQTARWADGTARGTGGYRSPHAASAHSTPHTRRHERTRGGRTTATKGRWGRIALPATCRTRRRVHSCWRMGGAHGSHAGWAGTSATKTVVPSTTTKAECDAGRRGGQPLDPPQAYKMCAGMTTCVKASVSMPRARRPAIST